jgi:hypothetical protein
MMSIDDLNEEGPDPGWGAPREGEGLGRELKRLWASEIRDYFKAEGEFLRVYGIQAGYESVYIRRVLLDHERFEKLVEAGGENNVLLFSRLLAEHFRYKDEYLARHLERITRIGPEDDAPQGPLRP